jgi:hypothetical protein
VLPVPWSPGKDIDRGGTGNDRILQEHDELDALSGTQLGRDDVYPPSRQNGCCQVNCGLHGIASTGI